MDEEDGSRAGLRAHHGTLVLVGAQLAVCALLLGDFLFGSKAFAYFDIGSDTALAYTPFTIGIARALREQGWPGWSFEMGLGHNLALLADPFTLLNAALGPHRVLELRAWVYGLKLLVAGGLFHRFLLATAARPAVAVPVALAYSFCGYALIDGQWDPLATELVTHALLLWAIARQLRHGGRIVLPLATALAFCLTPFFFALAVFVGLVALATLLSAAEVRPLLRRWLLELGPLLAAGVLLAAPRLLPIAIQMNDLARVSGTPPYLAEAFWPNDPRRLMTELAGFLHKDILSPRHRHGWQNYLESPGFFVGVLPLLLIPQLWAGGRRQRRLLLLGLASVAFYVVFPFLRRLAYGFQVDYFRVSTLWVATLLLVLHARALGRVLEHGVDRRALGAAAAALSALLAAVALYFGPRVQPAHAVLVASLAASALALLAWRGPRLRAGPPTLFALVGFVACESLLVGYPSLFRDRLVLSRHFTGYEDGTVQALAALRAADPGVYRIEKTYDSVGPNDALVQGYRGVKSYTQQHGATVAFFRDLGLLPPVPNVLNYENWIRGFGERYVLGSVLGVRYVLSRDDLAWPGLTPLTMGSGLRVYRNELALGLGVLHEAVLPRSRFLTLPDTLKDVALLDAAVLEDRDLPALPAFDPARLPSGDEAWLDAHYAARARELQGRGLAIEHFSDSRISGVVQAERPGLLVVTIPHAPGWSARVDGAERPILRVQLGMIGVVVPAGNHRVELCHRQPGFATGLLLAGLGAAVWLAAGRVRSGEVAAERPPGRTH